MRGSDRFFPALAVVLAFVVVALTLGMTGNTAVVFAFCFLGAVIFAAQRR